MKFAVVDVETANPDLASICQMGVAFFEDDSFVSSWSSLIDPGDYFDDYNVAVHGITSSMVRGAPNWPQVYSDFVDSCADRIVASHTPFDRTAIYRACAGANIEVLPFQWLDTARVVRRAWPQFSKSGYGLKNVAEHFGISFEHHNAEEDARAAGEILLKAIEATGIDAEQWCQKSLQSITSVASYSTLEVNPDGPLFGDVIVFTGALAIPRREAAQLAAAAGCEVGQGVTKKTTLLVVGDQDIRGLGGHEKSSKHRKAEALIKKGKSIRIIGETDFQALLKGNA